MRRIALGAVLLGFVVAIGGCQKRSADDAEPSGELGAIAVSENVDGNKVAVAVGRSLFIGITGGEANTMPPAQPPSF